MLSDDPPFLNEGDEVSAKYKGAFCEAVITNVQKRVECRVTLKQDQKTSIFYDSDIKGALKVGSIVEVKKDQNKYVEGTIVKITDQSMYTVVFDDGDSNTLKRSKLCPKGDRHFAKSNSLDGLPLTHPEHFWSPVKKESRAKSSATNAGSESDSDDEDDEERRQFSKFEDESPEAKNCDKSKQKAEEGSEVKWDESRIGSSSGEAEKSSAWWMDAYQDMIGRLALLEVEDKTKKQVQIVPVLVCLPGADENRGVITPGHVLVRSFKDSKFFLVPGSSLKDFNSSVVTRACKWSKMGVERAQQYMERMELPADWDKKELLGWSEDDGESMSDDEQNEKKDRFVAELYRFMDERGTPINKVPSIVPGVDVNLCSLYRAVQSLGGYNKVTNLMKWNAVLVKLNLKTDVVASSKVKETYKKFLHAFEEIDKRLGCSMILPNKVRSTPGRNLLSFRERDADGKKDVKSKKCLNPNLGSQCPSVDESETKNLSPPSSAQNVSSDNQGASTPLSARPGKKIKDAQKTSPISNDASSRSVKFPRTESERSESSNSAKVGKVKDTNPKSLRKLSREEFEKRSKEDQKPSLLQSQSNPNLMTGLRKAGEMKAQKAASDDMNRESRSRPGNKTPSSLKHAKIGDVDGGKMERIRSSIKVDWSEEAKKSEKLEKLTPAAGRRTLRRLASSNASEEAKIQDVSGSDAGHNRRRSDDILGPGTRVVVRYGKGKISKTYEAKVLEFDMKQGILKYLVHYNGWNSRYDEWLEREEIVNVVEFIQPSPTDLEKVKNPSHQAKASRKKSSAKISDDNLSLLKQKKNVADDNNHHHHRAMCDEHPRTVGRKRASRTTRSTASNESNEQNISDEESNSKDASDDDEADEVDKESVKESHSQAKPEEVDIKQKISLEDVVKDDEKDVVVDGNVEHGCDDDVEAKIEQCELTGVIDKHEENLECQEDEQIHGHVEISNEEEEEEGDDVMNSSGLGPPMLFSSQEMDKEYSELLGNKRLSSSTDCLPCLINEKEVVDEDQPTEVSARSDFGAVTEDHLQSVETKLCQNPARKRKSSEAEEENVGHKRQALDMLAEPQVDIEIVNEVVQAIEDVALEATMCEAELMTETVITLLEEKVEEVEDVAENDGSCEDLNSSQLHPSSEWVDSMENFNEVDCTLLSQFANECTKESDNMMSNRLAMSADNSPPETSSDDCCLEPAEVTVGDDDDEEEDEDEEKDDEDEGVMATRGDDEEGSTRSEREANQEVASYMKHSKSPLQPIIDSPSANEFSTASNDSCSALGRKEDVGCRMKRKKSEDSCSAPPRKKSRKDGNSSGVTLRRRRSNNRTDNNLSESDGESSPHHRSAVRATPAKMGVLPKNHSTPSKSSAIKSGQHQRIANVKEKNLNFLDLEEGKYLIGEERIDFIMRKITQLKVAYMELKSELACLDRRRRRHRMKEASQMSLQISSSNVAS